MVNYICPIFRFALQTLNGGYEKKNEDRYNMNVTYARFEYIADRNIACENSRFSSLLAIAPKGRFARRNVCYSATEISY